MSAGVRAPFLQLPPTVLQQGGKPLVFGKQPMFGEKVQMAAPLSKGAGVGDDFFWTSSMPIVLASAFTTRGRVKVARMENNFMIGALFLVALNENGVRCE